MPAHKGLWPDDHHGLEDRWTPTIKLDEEQAISSSIRRSTRFCVSLCGGGRYSPFDTICVGIGVAAEIASAPATKRCSRSLSQLLIVVLPCIYGRRDPVVIDKCD